MTTISDTFRDPTGVGVGGVLVRAALVAASEVLTGGGAVIREAVATTASDGTWSLTLTPISTLAVSTGAYYLVTADGHRWTIDVPASGTYTLNTVQIEPAPLPVTGATTTALAVETAARIAADAKLVAAVDLARAPIPGRVARIVFDANGDVDDIVLEVV
jgi:hypothetical protein